LILSPTLPLLCLYQRLFTSVTSGPVLIQKGVWSLWRKIRANWRIFHRGGTGAFVSRNIPRRRCTRFWRIALRDRNYYLSYYFLTKATMWLDWFATIIAICISHFLSNCLQLWYSRKLHYIYLYTIRKKVSHFSHLCSFIYHGEICIANHSIISRIVS